MAALDVAVLRKLMSDLGDEPEVVLELVATFLQEGPRLVGELRGALAAGDRRTVNRCAHSLKSTSATFGAAKLSQLCRELERESEAAIPADAPARVGAIEREWETVRAELAAWKP